MRVLSTQFYDRRGCMLGVSSIVYILDFWRDSSDEPSSHFCYWQFFSL